MEKRVNIKETEPGAYKVLTAFKEYVIESGIDKKLYELIKIRASQINGCAYCVDMHARDARKLGETEQRLYALMTWKETPFFTEAERAVLAFTEAVTTISHNHVSDEVYREVARHYNEKQIAALIMAIIEINSWNRIGVATKMSPKVIS